MENISQKAQDAIAFLGEWAGYITRFISLVQDFFADMAAYFTV